jgi:hypothetical protein
MIILVEELLLMVLNFPMMGTGNTVFFNWVTALENFFGRSIINEVQPNVAIQYSDFEGLNEAMVVFDLGVNLFFGTCQ